MDNNITVRLAKPDDKKYSTTITTEMEESAKARGTGIAQRSPEYVERKMDEGKAVIALTNDGTWVGFCYIESWENHKYVANSGLIVSPPFRHTGVAREIKKKIFELSRQMFPESKIFGLTTGLAVMKINSSLGYKPVTYSELTADEEFWKGCRSCVNFDILTMKNRKNCICTAMLYDPKVDALPVPLPAVKTIVTPSGSIRKKRRREFKGNFKLFERWVRLKQFILLRKRKKEEVPGNPGGQPEKKKSFLSLFFW